jgi:hypothetical protein
MILDRLPLRSPGLLALASLLLMSGAFTGCSTQDDGSASNLGTATAGQLTVEPTATIETVCIEVEWSEPLFKKEVLVSNVDQLFFARILSMGETIRKSRNTPYVRTPFSVEVEQRLLGDVEGTITVIQDGGYDRAYRNMVLWDCDPLLHVGAAYLLAGGADLRTSPEGGAYRLVATFRTIYVGSENHRQQLIQEYTEAIELAGRGR